MLDLPSASDLSWVSPNQAAIAAALHLDNLPAPLRIEHRDDRFVAFLPGDRLAWFPQSVAGLALIEREGRVLDLLAAHCSFKAPRVIDAGPNWQIRSAVPGIVDPWGLYRRIRSDPAYAASQGHALGLVLAEQHRSVPPSAVAGWLPSRPTWPYPLATIAADLPHVLTDEALVREALEVVATYEAQCSEAADPMLIHGDLGLHNLALAPDGTLAGVFDYGDAAVADRHRDFAYLLFDDLDDTLLRSAIAAYEASGGAPIDLQQVALCNAACAIGFMAFRRGYAADDRPAGRTIKEDMRWFLAGLARCQSPA